MGNNSANNKNCLFVSKSEKSKSSKSLPQFGAFALFPSFWIIARKNSFVVT